MTIRTKELLFTTRSYGLTQKQKELVGKKDRNAKAGVELESSGAVGQRYFRLGWEKLFWNRTENALSPTRREPD